jgi:hypothetical protein
MVRLAQKLSRPDGAIERQCGLKDHADTAKALSYLGRDGEIVGNTASSDGALKVSEIQGQRATTLSNDLVSVFGSNGSLSEADVDQALEAGATAPATVLQQITDSLDGNCNTLSNGALSMTAAQLSAAIAKYLPTDSDPASGTA